MRELFDDILSISDVHGVMLFSVEGKLLFKEFNTPLIEEPETRNWWPIFIDSLSGAREVDLVFERSRLYVRRIEKGYLMLVLGALAPMAMLRLNCDLLVPSLRQVRLTKGLRQLFRKGR